MSVLQQALLNLNAWVEKGIAPASTTNYRVEDVQVIVPAKTGERKGIQTIVDLTVKGKKRAGIKAGTSVTFTGLIEIPPHTGKIVSAEWDFEGAGTFEIKEKTTIFDKKSGNATVKTAYAFKKAGTYFPTLSVVSQSDGDTQTPFARILEYGW